jgi:glycosyltransferase involved in cell wall biosynthesis
MKFLFLSSHAHFVLDPTCAFVSGGAELQVALLARELAARKHSVVVVGGDTGQRDGVVFDSVRTRVGGKFQTGALFDTARGVPQVLRILREEQPDWVLILGWTTWLFLLWLARLGRYRLGFICGLDTEVNGEFRRQYPVRGALLEFAIRRANQRFAMSLYQQEQFARMGQTCGFYRNLVLDRFQKRGEQKSVDLLWVARCQPIKQPHKFLDLVESVPDRRCEMICPAEDQKLFASVQTRAAKLPNLRFLNPVPYREIQQHYDHARILVNTSSFEGYPNSFIQAGLGYTAILSLNVDPDGVLEKFGAGWCAHGDSDQFKRLGSAALQSTEKLRSAQKSAARFVSDWHDNNKNVTAFLEGITFEPP